MKLSGDQIGQLYKFTRQHFVEYYDVQTELVDHLANDIEETWLENPKISFEKARDISFKKFGVFGFMNVVEQKQKQMSKKYLRILWSFIKEWFQLPKIILTITFLFIVYNTVLLPYGSYFVWSFFILLAAYACYRLIRVRKELKKRKHKWMLEEMLLVQGDSFAFILATYPIHFINIESLNQEGWWAFIMSFLIVFIGIMIYISLEIIPSKAKELLEETYSEYKLSQNL